MKTAAALQFIAEKCEALHAAIAAERTAAKPVRVFVFCGVIVQNVYRCPCCASLIDGPKLNTLL